MPIKLRIICGLCVLIVNSVQSVQPVFATNAPPKEGSIKSPPGTYDNLIIRLEKAKQWEREGKKFLQEGYVDDAIVSLTKSLNVSPSPDVYAELADAQAMKSLYKEAESNYRHAVGLFSNGSSGYSRERDGDLQMRFALLLSKMGKYEDAIKMYEWGGQLLYPKEKKFLDLSFSSQKFDKPLFEAAAHTALSMEYNSHANYEEAMAHLRQAVALRPDFAPAQYYLGDTLSSTHHKVEARAAFKKASELGKGEIKEKADDALARGY